MKNTTQTSKKAIYAQIIAFLASAFLLAGLAFRNIYLVGLAELICIMALGVMAVSVLKSRRSTL